MTQLSKRKNEHLDLCLNHDVEATQSTLLEDLHLLHQALPEVDFDRIDTSLFCFGKRLKAPLLISGMTGGTDHAHQLNRDLSQVAQELGIAFGLGSQRSMLEDPVQRTSYEVRSVAPSALLIANLGAVQASKCSLSQLQALTQSVDADALALHLNPAQELRQPEGDRDFTGLTEAIATLVDALEIPIIVKETGCGLSPQALGRLAQAGVSWVDTAGRGGTSWPQVESLRNPGHHPEDAALFRNWGIPTAPSIVFAQRQGLHVIGSGGIRNGLEVAKAIALGASLVGMALPWLRALDQGGIEGAVAFGRSVIHSLKVSMLLTGASTLSELAHVPRLIGPQLAHWLQLQSSPVTP